MKYEWIERDTHTTQDAIIFIPDALNTVQSDLTVNLVKFSLNFNSARNGSGALLNFLF